MPVGWLFGALFFVGLFGAGYLSDVGAFEVLVAGLTDNTRCRATRAVWLDVGRGVSSLAIPPSINNAIFVPWDLTFGSGMQTLGLAARGAHRRLVPEARRRAANSSATRGEVPVPAWLFYWIRFGIPAAIGGIGVWWLLSSVFS